MCPNSKSNINNNSQRYQRCIRALSQCFELLSIEVQFDRQSVRRGYGFILIFSFFVAAAGFAFFYTFINHDLAEHFGFKPMYCLCLFVCLIQVRSIRTKLEFHFPPN